MMFSSPLLAIIILMLISFAGHTIAMAMASSSTNSNNNNNNGGISISKNKNKKTAVIVGGGPAGLAAALVLSDLKVGLQEQYYFERIVVLDDTTPPPPPPPPSPISNENNNKESSISTSTSTSYDPARAYFYNVNKRGQKFTNKYNINLSKRGVGVTEFARYTIPANPSTVFNYIDTKPFSRDMTDEERNQIGTMYWIPRHELIELITDEIISRNNNNNNNNNNIEIEIRRGVRCKYIEPTKDNLVKVVMDDNKDQSSSDDDDNNKFIIANFCVGADGISSNVRQSLEDGRFSSSSTYSDNYNDNPNDDDVDERPYGWTNTKNPSKKFGLKKYITPSTGLRIKGLRLQPNFTIPIGGEEEEEDGDGGETSSSSGSSGSSGSLSVPLDDRYNYGLMSTTTGPTDSLRLTILPQKDADLLGVSRSLNICTMPDHDLWDTSKIKNDDGGISAKAFFSKSFPRFDWNTIVSDKEWNIFASTKGSRFPPCQYSPTLCTFPYSNSNSNSNSNKQNDNNNNADAGVVLIGDALHAFPPDTGQGLNAAFCDVMTLQECFEDAAEAAASSTSPTTTTMTPTTLKSKSLIISEALKSYQNKNGPETRALISLARFGAPYQYNQPSMMMKFRKTLWTANVALRLLLNKVTKGISPKPAILLMMDSRLSFRQVMNRANTLTVILWSSFAFILLSLTRAATITKII